MNSSGTKTGLFLIELVVALLLFAFCAAICMQLFVAARMRTSDSNNLSQSVYFATSAAECYKSSGGSLEAIKETLPACSISGSTLTMLYGESAGDIFRLVVSDGGGIAEIAVFETRRDGTEECIYSLTVRAVSYVA